MYSARCRERLYPDDGFTAYRTIETGNGDELDRINYTYDNSTKNGVQRWRGPITGDAKVEWDNYFQNGGTEDDIDTDYWSNDWWIYKGIIFPDISSGYYSDSSFSTFSLSQTSRVQACSSYPERGGGRQSQNV